MATNVDDKNNEIEKGAVKSEQQIISNNIDKNNVSVNLCA